MWEVYTSNCHYTQKYDGWHDQKFEFILSKVHSGIDSKELWVDWIAGFWVAMLEDSSPKPFSKYTKIIKPNK